MVKLSGIKNIKSTLNYKVNYNYLFIDPLIASRILFWILC